MVDVWINDCHPYYFVIVDGEQYDSFLNRGLPLTWSQQADVAAGYREGLEWEIPR